MPCVLIHKFIVPVYLASFVWPLIQLVLSFKSASDFLTYSNTSGIGLALIIIAIGIVIYFVMKVINNSHGINTKMMFHELPPD